MRRDIYLSPSEIWPDKTCDLWWEWPSKKGQLYFGLVPLLCAISL